MELDFDKYCVVDGSPTTVLTAPKAAHRKSRGKPKCGNDLNENFREISFNRYRSASCRSRIANQEGNELLKRSSVYESSKETKSLKRTHNVDVGRKKIEFSRGSATAFSLGIIDSLCRDEDGPLVERNKSSVSLSEQSTSPFCKNQERGLYSFHQGDGNGTHLQKSLSAKLALPHSPGPKARKILEKREDRSSVSPAHLHGLLKMERKQGGPFFEFYVKAPEEVYIAKKCKVGKGLNWVYTFHSLHQRRRSNASGWGFKESGKESSVIGQMLVSCDLCTELKGVNESTVTEFVLYDIAHSRRSVSSQDSSCCSPDASKADDSKSRSKDSQPLSAEELHPGLEIGAIVMQVPFEKGESLKFKSGGRRLEKLIDLCRIEEESEGILDTSSPGKMHVVIPNGNHSLPSGESRGPSPLLDRWRLGGGCDCGGWDMACPLNVCGNPDFRIAEGQPLVDSRHPAELFVQGRKEDIPAFTMRAIEDGKYAVDFHAQLSSLQAFSICVAILHAAKQGRSTQMLQSDSLRVFAEDEIKYLVDTISEEEKIKTSKTEEVVLPSFVLNPPFSPIARV